MRGFVLLALALCATASAQTVTLSSPEVNGFGLSTARGITLQMDWSAPVTYRFTTSEAECFDVTGGTYQPPFSTTNTRTFTATFLATEFGSPMTIALKNIYDETNTNPVTVANTFTFTADNTSPTASFSSPQVTPFGATNASSVVITVQFSEPVPSFTATNVDAPNLTPTVGSGAAADSYTVTVAPSTEGDYTVTLQGVTDLAGNVITGTLVYSFKYDITPVTASYTSPQVDADGAAKGLPVVITVTFSEDVAAFTSSNVLVSPSLSAGVDTSSATVYTITLYPTLQSLYTVTLVGVTDKAGNVQPAGNTTYSFGYDRAPTASYSCSQLNQYGYTNASTVVISVLFSEAVTAFTASNIAVSPSLTPTVDDTNAPLYTITLSPSAQGLHTITLSGVTDLTGNAQPSDNTTFSFFFDNIGPTATYATSQVNGNGLSRAATITYTVTFTEPVVSFTTANLALTPSEPVTVNPTSSTVYTLAVTPANQGLHYITLFGVTDFAGNALPLNNVTVWFDLDNISPVASYSSAAVNQFGFSNTQSVTVRVTFSEPVASFAGANVAVSNGGSAAVTTVTSLSSYDLALTISAQGTYTITLSSVTDSVGNTLINNTYSFVYDTIPPVITFPLNRTNTSTNNVQLLLSERVQNFTAAHVLTRNVADLVILTRNSPLLYNVTFTLTALEPEVGQLTFSGIQDLAGNTIVPFVKNVTWDITPPFCNLTLDDGRPNPGFINVQTAQVLRVYFNETVVSLPTLIGSPINFRWPVQNLLPPGSLPGNAQFRSGPAKTGGAAFNRTLPTWDFNLACSGATSGATCGFTMVGIRDEAGNVIPDCPWYWIYDPTAPLLSSLVGSAPVITNDGFVTTANPVFTATFNEPVVFDDTTMALVPSSAGTISSFVRGGNGNGTVWNITLNLVEQRRIQLRWSVAPRDRANNPYAINFASNGINFTYDATAPLATLSSAQVANNGRTTVNAITVAVSFNESIVAFTTSDLTVVNGSPSIVTLTTGLSYNVTVTTTDDGAVSLTVRDTVTDVAGNPIAPQTYAWTRDTTAPTVSSVVAQSPSSLADNGLTNSQSVVLNVTFSETVFALTTASISVQAGSVTAASVSPSGSAQSYLVTLTNTGNGAITIGFTGVVDLVGNAYAGSTTFSYTYDNVQPTVTSWTATNPSSLQDGGRTSSSSVTLQIVFSETLTLTEAMIVPTNAAVTANSLSVVNGNEYTFTITMAADAAVSVALSGVVDPSGNALSGSPTFSFTYDTTAPTITSLVSLFPNTLSSNGYTNQATVVLQVTFDEAINALATNNVAVTGTAGATVSLSSYGDSKTWNVTLTNAQQGTVTASFTGVSDLTGNAYAGSDDFKYTYDTTAPTVLSIVYTANGLPLQNSVWTNFSSVETVITFSEEIVPLTSANIEYRGGTAALQSGSPTTETANTVFKIISDNLADGAVAFKVKGVTDRAGNLLTDANLGYNFDTVAPTITLAQNTETFFVSGDTSTIGKFAFFLDSTEPTLGVTQQSLAAACSGCTISNLQSTGQTNYQFDVTASAYGAKATFDAQKLFLTDQAGNAVTVGNLPAAFEFTWEAITTATLSCPNSVSAGSSFTCYLEPKSPRGELYSYGADVTSIMVLNGFTQTSIDATYNLTFTLTFTAAATTGPASITYNLPTAIQSKILIVDTPTSVQLTCPAVIAAASAALASPCTVKAFKGGNQIYFLPPTLVSTPAGLSLNPASFSLNPSATSADYSVAVTVPATTGKYVLSVSGASASVDIYSVATPASVAITCGSQYLQQGGAAISCTATTAGSVFVQSGTLSLTAGALTISNIQPSTPSNSFTFDLAAPSGSTSPLKYTISASVSGTYEVTVYTTAPTSAVVTCTQTYVATNSAANCKIIPKVGTATVYARSTLFTPSSNASFTTTGASGWDFAMNDLPFTITITDSVTGPALISSGFATETQATLLTTGTPTYLYLTCPSVGIQGATISCSANALTAGFLPVYVQSSAADFSVTPASATNLAATPDYGPAYVVSFSANALTAHTVQWTKDGVTNTSSSITILPPPSSFTVSCPSTGLINTNLVCTVTSSSNTVASAFTYTATDGSGSSGTFSQAQDALGTSFTFEVSLPTPVSYTITVGTIVGGLSNTATIVAYTTPAANQLTIDCPATVTASAVGAVSSISCTLTSTVNTILPLLGLSASVLAPAASSSLGVAYTTTTSATTVFTSTTFTLTTAVSGTVTFSSAVGVSDSVSVYGVASASTSTIVCNATVINVGDFIVCTYTPRGAASQNSSRVLIDAATLTNTFPSGALSFSAISPASGAASTFTFSAISTAVGTTSVTVGPVTISIVAQQPCATLSSCGSGYVAEQVVADLRINAPFPQTTEAENQFKTNFTNDMSAAGVPSDRLVINSLTPGSVIVNFAIKPSSNPTATSSSSILNNIKTQLNTPGSPLLSGSVTSATTGIVSQPSVLYTYCTTISPAALVPQSDCPAPKQESSSSNDGAVIGPAVAVPVAACIAAAVGIYLYKRRANTVNNQGSTKQGESRDGTEMVTAPSAVRIDSASPSTSAVNSWETPNTALPSTPLTFTAVDPVSPFGASLAASSPAAPAPAPVSSPLLSGETSSSDNVTAAAEPSVSRSVPPLPALPNVPESTSTEEAAVPAEDPARAVAPTPAVPEDPIAAIHPNDPAELMRQLRSHRSPSPRDGNSLQPPNPHEGAGRPSVV